ncbi:fibroblast growth factor 5 [Crotalus adamanteus]|uniref:Fibroblast growth factor n=1 Tax=Crotalus adamanteus TaxID=8729 RepID=A0AAW1B925_CROAD
MSKKGKLHASAKFTDDCKFRERFQENSYNTYSSAVHWTGKTGREWYVALNKRGKAKRGCSPRVCFKIEAFSSSFAEGQGSGQMRGNTLFPSKCPDFHTSPRCSCRTAGRTNFILMLQ